MATDRDGNDVYKAIKEAGRFRLAAYVRMIVIPYVFLVVTSISYGTQGMLQDSRCILH